VIGQPDEEDVERWRGADAPPDDLDRAPRPAAGPRPPSDAELVESVRGGAVRDYGQLYQRHVHAARALARQLAGSAAEADDLVADAFAKVLDALRAGGGPETAFRAYLLTALRNTAYDRARRDRRLRLADDVGAVAGVEEVTSVPFQDPAVATLERSLACRAFTSLPERWQAVLWQTEVEGRSPAELAPRFGLTTNGVAVLAHRAREGLKKAYLQAHLERDPAGRCRATVARLGAWTRSGLARRETTQVEAHLDRCGECRALAAELADVNGTLRAVVAPVLLGSGVAGHLVATAGAAEAGAAAGAAVGAGAGTTAGAGAGAGAGTTAGAGTGATAGAGTGAGAGATAGTTAGAGSGAGPVGHWLGAVASATAVVAATVWSIGAGPQPGAPPAWAEPPVPGPATGTTAPAPPTTGAGATTATTATAGATTDPATGATTRAATGETGPPAPAGTSDPLPPAAAEPLEPVVPEAFTLRTGGPPAELPVTLRNTGRAPAPAPTLTLSLPDGVQVVGPGDALAGRRLLRLDGAAPTVGCPAGRGAVTCSAERQLPPGGSVTFVLRLLAGPKAGGGTIGGTATAGALPATRVVVTLSITPKK